MLDLVKTSRLSRPLPLLAISKPITVSEWPIHAVNLRACEEIGMVIGHKRGEVGE